MPTDSPTPGIPDVYDVATQQLQLLAVGLGLVLFVGGLIAGLMIWKAVRGA